MTAIDRPAHVAEPPPGLGLLGEALAWLAGTQGAWPPHAPRQRRDLAVATGEGLAAGRAEADALADAGVDLLTLEAAGDPTAALVTVCALLDVEPVRAIGTAAGPGWSAQVVAVRDGLRAARQLVGDPEQLAADPLLGRVAGLLAQSAVRRTPVVLGGSVLVAAAGLVAERLVPGARHWWLAGATPIGPAAQMALTDLDLPPLLNLRLTTPGGAALAADLLDRGAELAS